MTRVNSPNPAANSLCVILGRNSLSSVLGKQKMKNNVIGFNASDAWLLLSLLYSDYPADRKRIEEVGDGINHSIFTDKEFKGGLRRLISAGYVTDSKKLYSPTKTVIDWYKKVSTKRNYIQKDLAKIEKFLTSHSS